MTDVTSGPLQGIRVLDLTGPLAEATGRVLADLGAEVLKIEPPGGCASRFLPPFVDGRDGDPDGSLFWAAWGHGKRSIVLDLAAEPDRNRFVDLVRGADVLVESARPGELEALGLGPAALAALNPTLVHTSVTPFGRSGPEATSPATDLTLSAAGGFLNCQGDRDRPPVPVGPPETSCSGAVQAAADTVLALLERERSGLGQHLDASLQAAVLWTLLYVTGYTAWGQDAPGMGDDRAVGPPNPLGMTIPVFARTADGYLGMTLVLGTPGARSLGRMMAWAGSEGGLDPDLAAHDWTDLFPLLRSGTLTPSDAQRGIDQLVAFFGTRSKHEIHRRAVEGRWLVAPAWNAKDLVEDEQLASRDYWRDVDGVTMPGPFARLSATPITYRGGAPRLGEHQHLLDEPRHPSVSPPASIPAVPARTPLLAGLKVADFSWVGAGPLVSKDLANLGATVVHIESEKHIDPLRIIPPFKDGVPNHSTGHCSANFNQSKLGLALDLNVGEARDVVRRLVEWADVVTESFVPGTAARYGLDYESVRAVNPAVVMLSSCMRGQTGPERTYTGFGMQGAALAGFVAVTGWPDRLPAGPFAAYSDFIAPRFSIAALGAALRHRERTGQGQYIDLSQIEAAIHFLGPTVLDYTVNGRVQGLRGADSDRACPHGAFATAGTERYVAIAVEDAVQWRALCAVLGLGAAYDDPALDRLTDRIARRADIEAAVAAACATREPFALATDLRQAGVPAYVVLRATDLSGDPQLRHRGHFVELDHPRMGPTLYDGSVTHFSRTPHHPTHAGPTIGQHTEAVLRELLGFDDDQIGELAATGALT
jgi:crotonobetainyl-CoA:carnitine CoA-transferase CaiB-like acyl-CoA transferase